MKGYLGFLILWILSKKSLTGSQISKELEKRRGSKPSPGTIYPALKELKEKGAVAVDKNKVYSLTLRGKRELKGACSVFCRTFYDVVEMKRCC